jgi:hypothetical protein
MARKAQQMSRRGLFTVGACLALALAGCGGGESPGVATAATGDGKPTASASAASNVVEEYLAGVRKYVQCMRDEGINLPDPNAKGQVDYSTVNRDGSLKRDPKFLAASKKCAGLQPPVPDELEDKGPPMTPEQIRYVRDYAKCMRANGVPDFPDPDADGHWPRTEDEKEGPSEQEAQAQFRAGQICEPVLQGRPTTTPNPNATGAG